MVNWTDHGTIASLATFPWAVQSNDAWAPQCVQHDGKFYLYVPVSVCGRPKNVIAVAAADSPLGPYKDAIGKPLIDKGNGYIDPTAFVDDDGQAYLYFGNPNAWYVKATSLSSRTAMLEPSAIAARRAVNLAAPLSPKSTPLILMYAALWETLTSTPCLPAARGLV